MFAMLRTAPLKTGYSVISYFSKKLVYKKMLRNTALKEVCTGNPIR